MLRLSAAVLALISLAGVASAQRFQPRPGLPLSPGVMPASPIGPGTQFIPLQTPRFAAPARGFGGGVMTHPGRQVGFGPAGSRFYGGLGYGFGGIGYGYGGLGYGYGYYPGFYDYPDYDYVPAPLPPPVRPEPNIALATSSPPRSRFNCRTRRKCGWTASRSRRRRPRATR